MQDRVSAQEWESVFVCMSVFVHKWYCVFGFFKCLHLQVCVCVQECVLIWNEMYKKHI